MSHSSLDPILAGLRFGLHFLVIGLAAFVVTRAYADSAESAPWVLATTTAFTVVYLLGSWGAPALGDASSHQGLLVCWILALSCLWAVLVVLRSEGAYLVFPLFFVYLRVLPGVRGVVAVLIATGFVIYALGRHLGYGTGGVVGPVVGAGVALLMGLAYRALVVEVHERERLLSELMLTRRRLVETERAQGALAERARLAREIHDTIAQGLSSIQMLLRAAERDAPESSAGYLALARETAADSLADARQIIGELTPSRLDSGLAAALRRLGEEQETRTGTPIDVDAQEVDLPMDVQTALLRIAQGALSNAVRHADATRIWIELAADATSVRLAVRDDGRGIDAAHAAAAAHEAGSFGLQAITERVEQFDGVLDIDSGRGRGTVIAVRLPVHISASESSEHPSALR